MVQHMTICQCSLSYQQTGNKTKHMIISLGVEKHLRQNATSLCDKGLGESRSTRNIPKQNKDNIQHANSQHQNNQSETTEIRNNI